MPNRTRWHAEIAGVFLLWVEEVVPDDPDGPPWQGWALSRRRIVFVETPEGLQKHMEPWVEGPFYDRSREIAMGSAVATVSNSFRDYADSLKFPNWIKSQVSDEAWAEARNDFIRGKDFKLP